MRISPQIKAAVEVAAERDHRSVTNLIEVLILNHCKAMNIDLQRVRTEETANEDTRSAQDE
jgi:hypothetical protein